MRPFQALAAILCLVAQFAFSAHQTSPTSFPPSPVVKVAVNPITNKVYLANGDANTVTAFNAATGSSTIIPVGAGANYIAINPATNRLYVNNSRDSSLTVIDGATDTVLGTYPIGSTGPIMVNPVTNIVYIVRLTGTGTDEVTYFNDNNTEWYTIATQSFQPNAMAINPVTNMLYIAHYASGDIRIISGLYDSTRDHPTTVSVGIWQHPIAITLNPITNKVYAIVDDLRGPISVLNGANNTVVFPAVRAGSGAGPKAIVANTVSNKVYAAFQGEVIVINGSNNALTYIPIAGATSGAMTLAVDHVANRILVASAQGTLTTIDGDTDTVIGTDSIPVGTSNIGINPITHTAYLFDTALVTRPTATGATTHAIPLVTTITPLAGNASSENGSITMSASSTFSPASLPVRKVYYQFDSTTGPWTAASGSGPFTASYANLSPGSHTVYAFAADGQDAPYGTGPHSMPLVGAIASYTFTVTGSKVDPTVSLAASANPSTFGESVTFTASVTGNAGTPTGTITFRDGTTTLCPDVALSGGAASCSSSTLTTGSHSITAAYSGNTAYNAVTSAALGHTVNAAKVAPTVAVSSSANPSTAGQSVTFTASVTGSSGVATGTVTFRNGANALCTGVTLSSGTATCATSALTAGTHGITAQYSGDTRYNGATSATLTQTVVAPKANPSVAVSSSSNPSTTGQAVTFTAAVGGSAGVPTGTVDFLDGSTAISGCSARALTGGSATCATSGLTAGTHSITARYSGNAAYNGATSPALVQSVANPAAPVADVSLTQSASASTVQAGSNVTFTLTAANSGPDGATGVNVSSTVPSNASFVSASAGCTHASGTVSCSLGSLAAGSSIQVSVVLRANAAGSLTHNASVTAAQGDPATGNNSSSVTVSVTSQPDPQPQPQPQPQPTPTLSNISTRGQVMTGNDVMIGGFVIGGSANKTVVVRARGPSLAAFGITNALANPRVQLVRSSDQGSVASNDDWERAGNAAELSASGFAPNHSLEAAILINLPPGAYTAIVTGADGGTGVGMVEVFEVDTPESPLTNLSTRGQVLTGNDVMIGGFVVQGSSPRTVLLRARGPSLAPFGITNALADPTLRLVRSSDQSTVATNDNWGTASNSADVAASGFAPGDARESVILITLPPGAYTAILAGANGTTGVGIIEVFTRE